MTGEPTVAPTIDSLAGHDRDTNQQPNQCPDRQVDRRTRRDWRRGKCGSRHLAQCHTRTVDIWRCLERIVDVVIELVAGVLATIACASARLASFAQIWRSMVSVRIAGVDLAGQLLRSETFGPQVVRNSLHHVGQGHGVGVRPRALLREQYVRPRGLHVGAAPRPGTRGCRMTGRWALPAGLRQRQRGLRITVVTVISVRLDLRA